MGKNNKTQKRLTKQALAAARHAPGRDRGREFYGKRYATRGGQPASSFGVRDPDTKAYLESPGPGYTATEVLQWLNERFEDTAYLVALLKRSKQPTGVLAFEVFFDTRAALEVACSWCEQYLAPWEMRPVPNNDRNETQWQLIPGIQKDTCVCLWIPAGIQKDTCVCLWIPAGIQTVTPLQH